MERHKSIPQPFFSCCIGTPKTHRCLNTLHPNPRDEFRTCWGRVEELLVAEELWNDHKKLIFFPVASAATYTDSHLEVDQRHRPCEGDGPTGRILRSCRDSTHRHVLKATKLSVAIVLPDLTTPSRSSHHPIAFCSRPIATLTGACRDLTLGLTALSLSLYVPAGNQAAAVRNGAADLHRNFRSLNPPRFSGSPDSDEVENWQEEIERIFQVMQCTNREKVVLATFQFTKDARAWWKATSAHLPNVGELEWAGFLEIFRGKYFSERVKEKKAAEFAALKQKGMSVAEYEAQFARLAVYAPHLVGTERLKSNRFMDGLRPMFIERLGPHNNQTNTKMVQRAQLVEDTMAKVEGMRGKDNSKLVFVKKGAPNIAPTFRNNNVNNNNKRPNTGRDVVGDKRVKVEVGSWLKTVNFVLNRGTELKNAGRSSGHA
ncbi:hypothetical protein Taro_030426 [Colocasia esculenta]|uniref:Retrotransposon gag domain-containing protein n=1 Tax=Colocasia esculenta TaxID=4460 RepID=A0A843VLE1_COLES|nr:hypothetical protein [Colocasia esculenta]